MKKNPLLFFILLFVPFLSVLAQNTIQLNILADLSSLDIGSLLLSNDLRGQPRYFQVFINTTPVDKKVSVIGSVDWEKTPGAGFKRLATFTSNVFTARNFSNDEIGNSDIQFDEHNVDKDLAVDLKEKSKPTGTFSISIYLLSDTGDKLDKDNEQLVFLNPAQTISILFPAQNSNVDVGNVQMSWTPVQGVIRYEVKATEVLENNPSIEEALNSGSPIVDAKNIDKNVTTIKLGDYKLRDWHDGQKFAVVVKAIYLDSGKENDLRSEPIVFNIGLDNLSSGGTKDEPGVLLTPDANMVRLAKLVGAQVEQNILDKLNNGTITLNQIQIEDENGQPVSTADFLNILALLETKSQGELSIKYIPKQ